VTFEKRTQISCRYTIVYEWENGRRYLYRYARTRKTNEITAMRTCKNNFKTNILRNASTIISNVLYGGRLMFTIRATQTTRLLSRFIQTNETHSGTYIIMINALNDRTQSAVFHSTEECITQ